MNDEKNLADPARLDEELVAYLDGELDAEDARRVEALLAVDAEVRHRLGQLSRTWEALDELAPATVDQTFTHTTLEMVAAAAEREVQREQAAVPGRRRRRWWLAGAGLLAAGLAGFLSVAFLLPDPNQALRRDLGVLDNLDAYRQVGDMAFLTRLAEADLFPDEEEHSSKTPAGSLPSRIEDRTPHAKAELVRQRDRFASLDSSQQERFRALHRQVAQATDRAELQDVMHRYYDWVRKLPPYMRAELLDLGPEARFKRVEKMRAEQLREATRRLDPQEAEAVLQWVEAYMKRLAQKLPEEDIRRLTETPLLLRRKEMMRRFFHHWKSHSEKNGPGIPPEDLAALKAKLSPAHQRELESKSGQEQYRLIGFWIRDALYQRFSPRRPGKPPVDEEKLTRFFEEVLSPREQDYLLGLPGDQMRAELEKIYLEKTDPHGRRPRRPFRHEHGKFDGPPPGPRPPGSGPRPRPRGDNHDKMPPFAD